MTSRIVINKQTTKILGGETKSSFVQRFEHLNNKNNVCKQTSSLYSTQSTPNLYKLEYRRSSHSIDQVMWETSELECVTNG